MTMNDVASRRTGATFVAFKNGEVNSRAKTASVIVATAAIEVTVASLPVVIAEGDARYGLPISKIAATIAKAASAATDVGVAAIVLR